MSYCTYASYVYSLSVMKGDLIKCITSTVVNLVATGKYTELHINVSYYVWSV